MIIRERLNWENKKEREREWLRLAQIIKSMQTFYWQNNEPVIPVNSSCFWVDTDAVPQKFYLVVNFDGVQKKVELS